MNYFGLKIMKVIFGRYERLDDHNDWVESELFQVLNEKGVVVAIFETNEAAVKFCNSKKSKRKQRLKKS